MTQEAFGWL